MFPLIYTNKNLLYLRNKVIHEYDIASGGYSCSLNHDLLSNDEQLILATLNKKDKQIFLGNKALQEKDFTKKLHAAFRHEIANFISQNEIPEENILSIKKDSITFFNSNISYTKNNHVTFTLRKNFTTFILLGKLEFYYNIDNREFLVKGISSDLTIESTLLEEIKQIMHLKSYKSDQSVYAHLKEMRENYLSLQLENSYYRELNALGKYKLKDKLRGAFLYVDRIDDDEINLIDIDYNYLNILLPLFKIFC
jgi:hypothetical protein